MSALRFWFTYPLVTFFLCFLPSSSGRVQTFSLGKGVWPWVLPVRCSLSPFTDTVISSAPQTRHLDYHQRLNPVRPHMLNIFSFDETDSSSDEAAAGSDETVAVECTIRFEGPVSEPPTVTVGPAPTGPFLAILRDTAMEAGGWVHGFQKGLQAGSSLRFGGSSEGEGEYAQVHPPHGVHVYELLIFDGNYALGPKLSALVGTPWQNPDRAMGSEDILVDDIRAGNPQSTPRIVGRCSTSVSHEDVASGQDDT